MHLTAFKAFELEKIHEASLKILEKKGVAFHSQRALDLFREHGATVKNDTVLISSKRVDTALKSAPSTFSWRARNDDHTMEIGTGTLGIQPNIGTIYVHDLEKGRRKSLFQDFINMQKLAQTSDIVNLVGSLPAEPGDLPQETKHLQMMYEVLKKTDKPVIGMAGHEKEVTESLEMMALAITPYTTAPFRENHWISVAVNPLSPLKFSPDAIETIFCYAKQNQPIFIPPAIMAGVTGPITPLGTIIQQNAEVLAGIVLIQLINPGNPVVYTCASTAAYMKNATFITGTPELPLIHTGGIQMGREYYKLPTRSLCGMSDAKSVDCQAGLESAASGLCSVLAGTDIVVEAMGCMESFLTSSYEKFIIDEEIMSRNLCIKNGVDASDDEIDKALKLILEVGHGDYLTHMSTMKNFRSRWTPSVSNWEPFGAWEADEHKDIVVRAAQKVKERLEKAEDSLISKEEDHRLVNFMEKNI